MKKLLLVGIIVLTATSASAQRETGGYFGPTGIDANYMRTWKAWHPNEDFYKFSQKPRTLVKARKAKR